MVNSDSDGSKGDFSNLAHVATNIADHDRVIRIAVARSKALTRAMIWSVPALVLGAATVWIYGGLDFEPSAASNRLVDYSIAVAASPIALTAALGAFNALRWLLLFAWPGRVAIRADEQALHIAAGPFGTRHYDAERLAVHYPFEMSADDDGPTFEAFLPEEEQLDNLLPRIRHPDAATEINRTILKFAVGTEAELAGALRPVIERWRSGAAARGCSTSKE